MVSQNSTQTLKKFRKIILHQNLIFDPKTQKLFFLTFHTQKGVRDSHCHPCQNLSPNITLYFALLLVTLRSALLKAIPFELADLLDSQEGCITAIHLLWIWRITVQLFLSRKGEEEEWNKNFASLKLGQPNAKHLKNWVSWLGICNNPPFTV